MYFKVRDLNKQMKCKKTKNVTTQRLVGRLAVLRQDSYH